MPLYIAQYAPIAVDPFKPDPRQHAIGLTFAVSLTGRVAAQGEAIVYEWFDVNKVPRPEQFGFGQDRVINACLKLMRDRAVTASARR
jgi:hypothetical protein